MAKLIYDVIIIFISVILAVDILYNLVIIRKKSLTIERNMNILRIRILLVVLIVLYSIYGILRNIL